MKYAYLVIIVVITGVVFVPAFGEKTLDLEGIPGEIIVNEKTNKIYVSTTSNKQIVVIDGSINKIETSINAGFETSYMDVNPNTNKIYLSYTRVPPTLYELDGQTNIIQEIPNTNLLKQHNKDVLAMTSTEDFLPRGVTVNSQKNLIIFPAGGNPSWVGIMNADNFELKAIFKGIRSPEYIDVNDKTNQIYIASQYLKSVGVVDGNSIVTRSEVPLKTTIEFFKPTSHIIINEKTNTIYVSHGSHDLISIIDGVTNKIKGEIKVSGGAYMMDVDESTNRLYVLSRESSSVKIIDMTSKKIVDEFSLPAKPTGLAINSATKTLYVGNGDGYGHGTLSIINTDDQNPPILTVPSPITLDTQNKSGRSVSFQVSATDDVDSNVGINCNPPSGSVFETGTTTVSCTATDSSGRTTVERFTVTVNLDQDTAIKTESKNLSPNNSSNEVLIFDKNEVIKKVKEKLELIDSTLTDGTTHEYNDGSVEYGYLVKPTEGNGGGNFWVITQNDVVTGIESHIRYDMSRNDGSISSMLLLFAIQSALTPLEEWTQYPETGMIGWLAEVQKPDERVRTIKINSKTVGFNYDSTGHDFGFGTLVLSIDYDSDVIKENYRTVEPVQKIEKTPEEKPQPETSSDGGGCLIATATYGSELAPQVQNLRELRDNKLLQTQSGSAFMESFNGFYYSFSPVIADYERENPVFREGIKIAITPMISSLSILNHVEMDTDAQVLVYGISLILLNIGMYAGVPVAIVVGIRKQL
jgi:DNA-binding beta-propeller fold protein YncE